MGPSATHVVLLGDSIFDNAAYTGGEPGVVTHLHNSLPGGWYATLCAVDGATTADLAAQLPRIPPNGSHVIVAVGGNDALQNSELLSLRVGSSAEALRILGARVAQFEDSYRAALQTVVELNFGHTFAPSTTVRSTRHTRRLPNRVAVFNDVIMRTAIHFRVDLLELRSVCTQTRGLRHTDRAVWTGWTQDCPRDRQDGRSPSSSPRICQASRGDDIDERMPISPP